MEINEKHYKEYNYDEIEVDFDEKIINIKISILESVIIYYDKDEEKEMLCTCTTENILFGMMNIDWRRVFEKALGLAIGMLLFTLIVRILMKANMLNFGGNVVTNAFEDLEETFE